jgi:hypothetical protein
MITTIFEKLFERMGYALTYTGIASVVLLFLGLEQVSGTVKEVIKAFHIHTGAYSVESLAVITAVLVPLNLISLGITLAMAAQYRYLHGLYEKQPENLAKLALMTMVVVVVCAVMATTLAYLAMVGIVWYVIAWLTGLSLMFVQAIGLFKVAALMERLVKDKGRSEETDQDSSNPTE